MRDRGAIVVGEKHQNLHLLAAIGHQAVLGHVGTGTLTQAPGRTGNGRPTWVAFVVAGNHRLAKTGHRLHRLHAGDAAHLEVEGFHRTHHRR
ncbi:hypothetical protein D3C81_1575550 [compost metagenome]